MSINLNDSQFAGKTIFNNGKAGVASNVKLQVVKKTSSDKETAPDYKVIFTDSQGGELNEGFYYFKPRPGATPEEVKKAEGYELSRLVHFARAVMGKNAQLPEVSSVQAALDTIMKLVNDNVGDKQFNIFVSYGTVDRPSQYLGLRRFNFIEPATEDSGLFQAPRDNMDRVTPDTPSNEPASTTATSGWS